MAGRKLVVVLLIVGVIVALYKHRKRDRNDAHEQVTPDVAYLTIASLSPHDLVTACGAPIVDQDHEFVEGDGIRDMRYVDRSGRVLAFRFLHDDRSMSSGIGVWAREGEKRDDLGTLIDDVDAVSSLPCLLKTPAARDALQTAISGTREPEIRYAQFGRPSGPQVALQIPQVPRMPDIPQAPRVPDAVPQAPRLPDISRVPSSPSPAPPARITPSTPSTPAPLPTPAVPSQNNYEPNVDTVDNSAEINTTPPSDDPISEDVPDEDEPDPDPPDPPPPPSKSNFVVVPCISAGDASATACRLVDYAMLLRDADAARRTVTAFPNDVGRTDKNWLTALDDLVTKFTGRDFRVYQVPTLLADREVALRAIVRLQIDTVNVVTARLKDDIARLTPFPYESAAVRAEKMTIVRAAEATRRTLWRQATEDSRPTRSMSTSDDGHRIQLNDSNALRQLKTISVHGWGGF